MLKTKVMAAVVGLSLILAGCADNHKASQTRNEPAADGSQQTSIGNSGSNENSGTSKNTNVGTSQSNGSSVNSGNSTSQLPKPPVSNPATQPKLPDMKFVTAVRLADFNTGWVGGNGWIAKTTSGGKNWAVVYQGSGTVQQLFALNHLDVWATLNQNENRPRLLYSNDGGQHWVKIGTVPNKAFLHFTSQKTAFSGNYMSQDGGKTWHSLPIPEKIIGNAYFHDVKNGWVVTQAGSALYVRRTKDGGKSWNTVLTKRLVSPIDDAVIRSAGPDDAWIELIGGTGMTQTSYSVFHSMDGGISWRAVIANSTAGGGPAPGIGQDDQNVPSNKGTKPGSLYVVSPQTAFMSGLCPACDDGNSIGWTKDAGKTWVNSNVTFPGNGGANLAFSDTNHGWWITTEIERQSVMYTTENGGVNWHPVHIFQ